MRSRRCKCSRNHTFSMFYLWICFILTDLGEDWCQVRVLQGLFKSDKEQQCNGRKKRHKSHKNKDDIQTSVQRIRHFTKKAMLKPCRSFARCQHNMLLQGFNSYHKTCDGTKNSPEFGGIIFAGAARHYRSAFRSKRCVSQGISSLNEDGRPAGRTGLNSNFIILFPINKLKPEKT